MILYVVKQKIQDTYGFEVESQRLIFQQKVLQDNRSVMDYNLQKTIKRAQTMQRVIHLTAKSYDALINFIKHQFQIIALAIFHQILNLKYNFYQMDNKSLKIIVVSDTHGFFDIDDYQALPQSDILIHCGDFTQDSQLEEIQSFISLLSAMKNIQKVVIPGNHQFIFDQDKEKHEFKEQQVQEQRDLLKKVCHFLEFQMINVKGINILGISKRPSFFDWNFDFVYQNGKEIVEKYKDKVDILITHWPPYGILDQINKKQRGGSKGLLKFVQQIRPKVHLFGHIHEAYGFKQINQTKFYNASFLDKNYNPKNKPHIVQFSLSSDKYQQ